MLKLALALAAMAAALVWASGTSAAWLHYAVVPKLSYLAGLVALGAITYFGALMLLGIRPRDFMRRAKV